MPGKKTENAEITPAQQESAITSPRPPAGPILASNTRPQISDLLPPRMNVVQGVSASLINQGGKPGQIFVELPDRMGGPKNFESLRLCLIDSSIRGRVMFRYDPLTGKGVMGGDDNSPWCGSNDGINPRPQFEGEKYIDPRNGLEVVINQAIGDPLTNRVKYYKGCANCPLGNWHKVRDHKTGEPVLDDKGKPQTGAPPCQETVTFVFWAVDLGIPVMIQTSAFMIRAVLLGNKNQNERGVDHYYTYPVRQLADGAWTTPTWDGENTYPLVMTTQFKPTAFGGVFAPKFEVSKTALSAEEYGNLFGDEAQGKASMFEMYTQPMGDTGYSLRQYITGEAFATGEVEDDLFGDSTESGESQAKLSPEEYKKLLGNGGSRRATDGDVNAF